MKEDNHGQKYFKGDNSREIISFVLWVFILCDLTHMSSFFHCFYVHLSIRNIKVI